MTQVLDAAYIIGDPHVRRHKEIQVDCIPIHERPNFINRRQRIGDWEIDTVSTKPTRMY